MVSPDHDTNTSTARQIQPAKEKTPQAGGLGVAPPTTLFSLSIERCDASWIAEFKTISLSFAQKSQSTRRKL
jgi:hypothetical protein